MKLAINNEKSPNSCLKKIVVYVFLLAAILTSSCANNEAEKLDNKQIIAEENAQNADEGSREALFVYGGRANSEITLLLGGDPQLLSSSYARLAGAICGEKPVACLEVGGKGVSLAIGEITDGYQLIGIMKNKAKFKKDDK
ncbi:MAG TPA: hypothetical protein VJB62_02860 [Patescibacteria group bacterium]|nr:hypothetical protein [Patescibacteria group bacterium]